MYVSGDFGKGKEYVCSNASRKHIRSAAITSDGHGKLHTYNLG